jgi:hypothetical protein
MLEISPCKWKVLFNSTSILIEMGGRKIRPPEKGIEREENDEFVILAFFTCNEKPTIDPTFNITTFASLVLREKRGTTLWLCRLSNDIVFPEFNF